jgi:hypothetical protein
VVFVCLGRRAFFTRNEERELSTEIERLYPATVLSSRGVSFANVLSDLEKRLALIDGWWAPAVTK